jgi:hypothetical protein
MGNTFAIVIMIVQKGGKTKVQTFHLCLRTLPNSLAVPLRGPRVEKHCLSPQRFNSKLGADGALGSSG